ncbi:signal peptidase I [Liquorilactobacillus mali]|uniref:signal peptidase I n=1 Tax=Liquorilactobacillus mali TaxID=1618 RepID=UPI002952CB8A|nr:signal peptidase I [Liquorilactobacillus mali]MDV7757551.1 signal peptidase I [Liquorilactobacillus mali]
MTTFKNIMSWVWPIIIGLILAFIVKTFLFSFANVVGDSMAPNLKAGEHVALLKTAKIKRNSIIIFNAYGIDTQEPNVTPKTKYIKRVIGLPGDKIEYRNNGTLYVNNKLVSQAYISKKQQSIGTLTLSTALSPAQGVTLGTNKSFTVPKGKYFVLGDNRKISNDSRYYGFVPKTKILGVVKAFIWSKHHKLINSFNDN